MPRNRPVALTYASVLNEHGDAAAGQRAQAMLRPLLAQSGDDPVFQQPFARASELAGDPVRAGEAYAEAAFLNGRPEQALVQLNTLKKRRRPGLLRPRPHRCAHRGHHPDGARNAPPGRRGPERCGRD